MNIISPIHLKKVLSNSFAITVDCKKNLMQIPVQNLWTPILNAESMNLITDFSKSFMLPVNAQSTNKIDLNKLKNVFFDFAKNINNATNSKFVKDVYNMKYHQTYKLMYSTNKTQYITCHFLMENESNNHVQQILHAINTYCNYITYNYNHCVIYICLDSNTRSIYTPNNYKDLQSKFDYYSKQSTAFTVSGVTNRNSKQIICTKTQEIIKLLYHELTHYARLESEFYETNVQTRNLFCIADPNLNLSEAYAEFVAVILTTAYNSVYFSKIFQMQIYNVFTNLLLFEREYSYYLCANILKFYGYTRNTFRVFFKNCGEKMSCPIAIWEYVLLRSQLMYNFPQVINAVTHKLRVNVHNLYSTTNLMNIREMINKIEYYMINTEPVNNLSYMVIDLN